MKISFDEFKEIITKLVPRDEKPIVVYSGLWYIGRSFQEPFNTLPSKILEFLLDISQKNRTLVMPTYTTGFKNGTINLDQESSLTGVLTEMFRKQPNVIRTASAFFSFAAMGPESLNLQNLRPQDAWGDASIFQWMEDTDAHLVMLGEPWDACSLKHRAEWLQKVPYRYRKEFEGEMVRGGQRESLRETLYVRSLDPLVENTWHNLPDILSLYGMKSVALGSGQIAHMTSKNLLKAMLSRLDEDVFAFTHDPDQVRALFS